MSRLKKIKPIIVGITGGIASGKSTVSEFLQKKKYVVICADEIVRTLLLPAGLGYSKVIKLFGEAILNKDGSLNKIKMAEKIFNTPLLKKKLEALLHPLVKKEIQHQIKTCENEIIFLDIPLLFETDFYKICDVTICVATTQKQQIERLKVRNGYNKNQAMARIQNQLSLKEKIKRADFILWNKTDKESLKKELHKILLKINNTNPKKPYD